MKKWEPKSTEMKELYEKLRTEKEGAEEFACTIMNDVNSEELNHLYKCAYDMECQNRFEALYLYEKCLDYTKRAKKRRSNVCKFSDAIKDIRWKIDEEIRETKNWTDLDNVDEYIDELDSIYDELFEIEKRMDNVRYSV